MNGWKRLGVVISGAWILLVVSYAAYEFYTFPLKPFVSYTGSTAAGYEGDRQGFWFVRAVTKSGPESLTATERTFFEKQIKEAKTDEERQIHVAAYNVPETSSGLKPLFFALLAGPVVFAWGAAYFLLAIVKWVRGGFLSKK